MNTSTQSNRLSLAQVLIFGGLMVTLSMGIRHGFGLFNLPITMANGWGRETFALTIALQNLIWGAFQPITGALADRYGALKIMVMGGILYALGLAGMALSTDVLNFTVAGGLFIGLAQTATTYSVVYGVLGRNVSAQKRVWAMGITAAAGSFGQFLMIPTEQGLISSFGAQNALMLLALMASMMIPVAFMLREKEFTHVHHAEDQTIAEALKEALKNSSFQLLAFGYFVCGFQVVFIAVHLAPYLKDLSSIYPSVGAPSVATSALALIGLFNIFGTYGAGILGQRIPKRYLLAGIYLSRSIVIIAFISLPLSPMTTYVFASLMGFLWLATIPLTNGIVAQIFGVKHLSMLSGLVFFSHQMGSFCGAYFGGYLFDKTGSYTIVWQISIALGVIGFLVNLPIKERAVTRMHKTAVA
ncbi:MFS transporter [Polynucleobacter sphagniphilus]|jgi:MFS family permease|uniref:MFS transporter n=1 Tax=Polynucleobacter sphagniphilus TaxID=1743169 RepID=UPI00096B69B1|nr:MFS transporter [Polynucleobacter sphagniphilus]MDH6155503.1 MFS family permease [Polynucleobacter sphagniphilus]MDH6249591.1 MFS family permease [Polynucleobacter sphagniphilus]MDH6301571.1 MFS family permease [Polynucleobacter sphagniphilus]MDH6420304.1 MFS family permease [Polynucleobacter sphagniphilus]OLY96865.1 MFS transporter [Polynucleobacter sphagniphilus]